MAIDIIYILVFMIFSFLTYLIVKSIMRGFNGKNRNKKKTPEMCISVFLAHSIILPNKSFSEKKHRFFVYTLKYMQS